MVNIQIAARLGVPADQLDRVDRLFVTGARVLIEAESLAAKSKKRDR